MPTTVWTIDAHNPSPERIAPAAACLRRGGLVAFPTETVYGLGANAYDAAAVRRLFAVKGRPPFNPLIVHIAELSQIPQVAAAWPAAAQRLAERFWPGPLTLVVPKHPAIVAEVTAGGPTVAVRLPAHPVARALIRAAGVPVAAPSANRSGELSPTRAAHVLKSLGRAVDIVLDAGPCPRGIESTVVDVTGAVPRILRPGPIPAAMVARVAGVAEEAGPVAGDAAAGPLRSPGQLSRHYAPRTRLLLVPPGQLPAMRRELEASGRRYGMLELPDDPEQAAAVLYDRLHQLDAAGYALLLVCEPPDTPEWAAIRDRLRRAAAPPDAADLIRPSQT